ncbi:MAG: SDR family NAD(P)-dependent oxidoreductase, partial [Micrococcales bacterium]
MALDYRGKTALVTGASSGIGVEFAHRLAARGANLILVARRKDRLQVLAKEITAKYGVTVSVIAADLSVDGAAKSLHKQLARKKTEVDILINNAGFGTIGEFATMDEVKIGDQIRLNVLALVELTREFVPSMKLRNSGVVVNIASTAAYQPVPYMAVYAATKAFVLSFTEALWGELRGTNVHAIALSPGGTKTEFFDVASNGKTGDGFGKMQTVNQVVETAINALDAVTP